MCIEEALKAKDEYELAEMYDALNKHLGRQETRGYKFFNNEAGVRTLKRQVDRALSKTNSFEGVEGYRKESDYVEVSGERLALYDAMRLYDHEAMFLEKQLTAYGFDWGKIVSKEFKTFADFFHSKDVMMGKGFDEGKVVLKSRIEKMQQISSAYAELFSNVVVLDHYRH